MTPIRPKFAFLPTTAGALLCLSWAGCAQETTDLEKPAMADGKADFVCLTPDPDCNDLAPPAGQLKAGLYQGIEYPTSCLHNVLEADAAEPGQRTVQLICNDDNWSSGKMTFGCDGAVCERTNNSDTLTMTGDHEYRWDSISAGKLSHYTRIGDVVDTRWNRDLPTGEISAIFYGKMNCSFEGGTEIQYMNGYVTGVAPDDLVVDWKLGSSVVNGTNGGYGKSTTVAGHTNQYGGLIRGTEITHRATHLDDGKTVLACSGRYQLFFD